MYYVMVIKETNTDVYENVHRSGNKNQGFSWKKLNICQARQESKVQ